MNTFKKLLGIMASFCLISVSCVKEEQNPLADGSMKFASTLLSTKATDVNLQATQLEEGVKVGVFVKRETSYISNGNNNVLTADGAGNFTCETAMYWPSEASVNIHAYAPYNASWTGAIEAEMDFTVSTDQSSDAGYLSSDLLVGAPESNPIEKTESPVELKFAHMLSKVNVNIVNENLDVNLQGAVVNLLGLNTSVKVNVAEGTLGASSVPADIRTAAFAGDAVEFSSSAVVVPQTVAAGPFVQLVLADSRVLEAGLASDVEFKSNKRYVYTVNISGDEDQVQVSITLGGSSIGDWEDDAELGGDTEEVIEYVVGDYVLADGSFMKKADYVVASDEVKAKAAGVIFSTNVSAADAAAGYDGYAMSLVGVKRHQTWRTPVESATEENPDTPVLLRASEISTAADAMADLDGLSFASLVAAATDGGTYGAFNFTNYSANKMALTGANLSNWFMPSFGQLVLLLNNLAGAGIEASAIELNGQGNYEVASPSGMIELINGYLNADKAGTDVLSAGAFVVSSTESSATLMWGVEVKAEGYRVSSKAGKSGGSRNVIPVFAYKK